MKALAASGLLIALLSVAQPVGAHQISHMGTLVADQPYTVNIDNAANAAGKATLVVYYLTGGKPATAEREAKLGKAPKFDIVTVGPGGRETRAQVIPKGTRLIVCDVAPPKGGTVIFDVRQGANNFSDTFTGGGMFLFDLE